MMARLRAFRRDNAGSVLAEFAIVLPLFLILLFALVDFGQIYLHWLLAEKATHLAVRLAVVSPPLCAGVPTFNDRGFNIPQELPFGSSCGAVSGLCANPGTVTCSGATAIGSGFDDIFTQIGPFLPVGIQAENVQLTYSFADLGFLGGPYVPLVSVELSDQVEVPFITPLGPLLQAISNGGSSLEAPSIPTMRATLPAEDLVEGGPG